MIYNIYDKDMYVQFSLVVNSIYFVKCGFFCVCYFVVYVRSYFIINLNVIREVYENLESF